MVLVMAMGGAGDCGGDGCGADASGAHADGEGGDGDSDGDGFGDHLTVVMVTAMGGVAVVVTITHLCQLSSVLVLVPA